MPILSQASIVKNEHQNLDCRMGRTETMLILSQASIVKNENPDTKRGPWNQREDQELLELVRVCGPHNWVDISTRIRHRTPKQCRERYHQNLKPTLNHAPISYEEGVRIVDYFRELGPKWAEIARHLQGRSDNSIKNWWNGSVNRRRRQEQHEKKKQESSGRRLQHRGHNNGQLHPEIYGLLDQRPLPPIYIPTSHQYAPPLQSPARSESTGETPSLVSDNSVHSTPSPKTSSPLQIQLPPMMTRNEDVSRSNVLRLHTSSTVFDFNFPRVAANGPQPSPSSIRDHYEDPQKPASFSGASYCNAASEPAPFNSYPNEISSSQQRASGGLRLGLRGFHQASPVDGTHGLSRVEQSPSSGPRTLPPMHNFQKSTSSETSHQMNPGTVTNMDRFTNQPESPDRYRRLSVKNLLNEPSDHV